MYKISSGVLVSAVEDIRKRKNKIKLGVIFIEKRNYTEDKSFLDFYQKRQSKLSSLIETLTAQLNYLGEIWSQCDAKEVENHSAELAKVIKILEKDWEYYYSITTSEKFKKLHQISCEFFDSIFDEIERFVLELKKAIENHKENNGENVEVNLSILFEVGEIANRIEQEVAFLSKK